MKFIWYIIALTALFAALVAYYTNNKPRPLEKDIAIIINDKHITRKEYDARFASVNASDKHDFINSLIVKELMIQAALKEGVDKDEAFRRSIEEYYEESLIKQIVDKKFNSLKVKVSNDEIDHFSSFQNSSIQITVLRADDENAVKKGQFKAPEVRILRVNDLAGDISGRLEALKVGGSTSPLCSDSGCEVFRLDRVTAPASEKLSAESRRKASGILLERKRQRAMDSWIADLRAKSAIRISIK